MNHPPKKMPLTPSQIHTLKKLAHGLKPVVIIGQHGLTEGVIQEIDFTLDHHELIKIKLAGADKGERKTLSSTIAESLSAEQVQIVDRIATFYRANPNKKKDRVMI
jgi:RNA-binding protein